MFLAICFSWPGISYYSLDILNLSLNIFLLRNRLILYDLGGWRAPEKLYVFLGSFNELFFVSVHNVEPDMTREGGSIPVTLTFQEATGKNVMLLPMGCADDGAHSQNEKLNRSNFLLGVRFISFNIQAARYLNNRAGYTLLVILYLFLILEIWVMFVWQLWYS